MIAASSTSAERAVVIVGAGPAGIRAAETLLAHGVRPLIIDEASRSGGQIYRRQPQGFHRSYAQLYGSEAARARALHATFDAVVDRIDYRPQSLVWNIADGSVHVLSGQRATSVGYDALILATGATDRVLPVAGWTRPGVYTLGAAQIALKAQACAIGQAVVFLGSGPLLYLVAWQYRKAGANVIAVLDTSPLRSRVRALPMLMARPSVLLRGIHMTAALRARGVRVLTGVVPLAIAGSEHGVAGVRFRVADGETQQVRCDAVGLGWHLRPETQLADLAGCRFRFEALTRLWIPDLDVDGRSSLRNVYLAGDGSRVLGADAAEAAGQLAAYAVLQDRGVNVADSKVSDLRRRLRRYERFRRGLATAFAWPETLADAVADNVIVCRCELISAGELRRAVRSSGATEINRAKAFCRLGMGRCQGRYCGGAGSEIIASAAGVAVEQVGRMRSQAPVKPLPLASTTYDEVAP